MPLPLANSPHLFDAPPVGNDKARAMYLSQYSDEPPTSLSTTTFSKNSQLTPPPLLPCSPPFHLAYYTPANADGRQIPGDSAVEAAYNYRLTWILRTFRCTQRVPLFSLPSILLNACSTSRGKRHAGGMLYVGTIPSEKYIPDASLGITSDGFFDLEEQPKRVAVVRPVELAGVFNQPPLHKPGVWRIFPAAIPLLSPRVEQVLGGHLLHIQALSQAYRN
ncbi:hypothetical protein F5877DRAFT_86277 [Lentinula edodes]|nr:hypothetical protein F5877DRAFT_86277 [Lentinula edodes]